MSNRQSVPLAVAICLVLLGLGLGLKSAMGFVHAGYRETEVGMDKFSAAPIHVLIERGVIDLAKATEIAQGTPMPAATEFQKRRALNRFLFSEDARLAARQERIQGGADAVTSLACLVGGVVIFGQARAARSRRAPSDGVQP